MHSVASLRSVTNHAVTNQAVSHRNIPGGNVSTRAASGRSASSADRLPALDTFSCLAEPAFRVAFVGCLAQTSIRLRSPLAPNPDVHSTSPDEAPSHPRWQRHHEALCTEEVSSHLLWSSDELLQRVSEGPACPWVVVLAPDELGIEQLARVLAVQRAGHPDAGPAQLVALCSPATSPQKLWRLFEAGACLADENASPRAVLRLVRRAGQGVRSPLVRFCEQARLSASEQRAFFAECAGLNKCEAAEELGCTLRTLETYWSRIFAKLEIRSTDGVVAAALRFAMFDEQAAEL